MVDYELPQGRVGILYVKSMIKLVAIFFAATELILFYPSAALIFLFIVYFTMPTFYYRSEPFKAAEAWMRMLVGYLISVIMFYIFSGKSLSILSFIIAPGELFGSIIAGNPNPASSLALLALAFFATTPRVSEREGVNFTIEIKNKDIRKVVDGLGGAAAGAGTEFAGNLLFLMLVLLAGIPMITGWVTGNFQIIFGIIWIISMIMGWFGGREGRPYIGIFVIAISFFAFAFSFTGTFGQAIFGAFWPQIYSVGSQVFGPLGEGFSSAGQGLSDAWLLLTCPSCYYQQQLVKQQQLAGTIKEGGTTKTEGQQSARTSSCHDT